MKVAKFIEIISRYFSNQIPASETTGRVSNGLRYRIVLTWFTDISADENGRISEAINKKDASCDKYFSETNDRDMPITDAQLIVGKVIPDNFEDIFYDADLSDSELSRLQDELSSFGYDIDGDDYPTELTDVFIQVLKERAETNKKSTIRGAQFIGNDKVQIGGKIINLPPKLEMPNLPAECENKYITALLEVYSVDSKTTIASISDLDNAKQEYKTDLQFHREDFYNAESVLHQVRDFFYDGEFEFNAMKDEIYQAIKRDVCCPTEPYKNMCDVMKTVCIVSFSKSYLSASGNGLVGPSEKRGMVHLLINDGKCRWL
mgnify:CR=1 FL=1